MKNFYTDAEIDTMFDIDGEQLKRVFRQGLLFFPENNYGINEGCYSTDGIVDLMRI